MIVSWTSVHNDDIALHVDRWALWPLAAMNAVCVSRSLCNSYNLRKPRPRLCRPKKAPRVSDKGCSGANGDIGTFELSQPIGSHSSLCSAEWKPQDLEASGLRLCLPIRRVQIQLCLTRTRCGKVANAMLRLQAAAQLRIARLCGSAAVKPAWLLHQRSESPASAKRSSHPRGCGNVTKSCPAPPSAQLSALRVYVSVSEQDSISCLTVWDPRPQAGAPV